MADGDHDGAYKHSKRESDPKDETSGDRYRVDVRRRLIESNAESPFFAVALRTHRMLHFWCRSKKYV
jgi:hypothetical protein